MRREISIYLDVVRFVAALLVVFGHAYSFTEHNFKYLAGHGPAAVSVFFVLSGFVISYVTSAKEKSGKQYAVARLARIYSVAVPVLLVTLLMDQIGSSVSTHLYEGHQFNPHAEFWDVIRYLTFTNELWNEHVVVGSNEPFWSLGFEIWYYIVFGFYFYLPTNLPMRTLVAGLMLAVAGPKIAAYFPMWLFGVYCHRLLKKWDADPAYSANRAGFWAWAALFVTLPLAYLVVRYIWEKSLQPMFWPVDFNSKTGVTVAYFNFVGSLFAVSILAFYKMARSSSAIEGFMAKIARPVQWLAGATFTLYLAHQPIILALATIMPGERGSKLWAYSVMAAAFALIFALAEVSERRKIFWRRLFEQILGEPSRQLAK